MHCSYDKIDIDLNQINQQNKMNHMKMHVGNSDTNYKINETSIADYI